MLQKLFKWLPLILLIFLFIIDRHNPLHVALYIAILLTYSGILVLKIYLINIEPIGNCSKMNIEVFGQNFYRKGEITCENSKLNAPHHPNPLVE